MSNPFIFLLRLVVIIVVLVVCTTRHNVGSSLVSEYNLIAAQCKEPVLIIIWTLDKEIT